MLLVRVRKRPLKILVKVLKRVVKPQLTPPLKQVVLLEAQVRVPRLLPLRNKDRRPLKRAYPQKCQLVRLRKVVKQPNTETKPCQRQNMKVARILLQKLLPVHPFVKYRNFLVRLKNGPPNGPLQKWLKRLWQVVLRRRNHAEVWQLRRVLPPKRRRPARVVMLLKRKKVQVQIPNLPPMQRHNKHVQRLRVISVQSQG